MTIIVVAILALPVGVSNYCFLPLRIDEMVAFIVASIFCLMAVFSDSAVLSFVEPAMVFFCLGRQILAKKKQNPTLTV